MIWPFRKRPQPPNSTDSQDTPRDRSAARRQAVEDVLAHWNPCIPTYGIPPHAILALREEIRREHDDEAGGHPRGATTFPLARRLRALFRRAGREALR